MTALVRTKGAIKTIALSLCVLGLAVPVAGAQTPSETGFGETRVLPEPPTSDSVTSSEKLGVVPADQGSGSMPFTGVDAGIVVLTALALLAAGVGLRQATAKRSSS